MNQFLKRYRSAYDKTLINYKQLREEIGKIVNDRVVEIKLKAKPEETDIDSLMQPFKSKASLNAGNLNRLY